jgi:hypothetical protein
VETYDPYRDDSTPGFIDDGDRFDTPLPRRRFRKAVRSVAALVLSGMLFAAGTPISGVAVITAILMFLIWTELWSSRSVERDDVI